MVCIAAFIVLLFVSIFSVRSRKMLGKAWGCVAKKVTFRPCDTNFKDEIKNGILKKTVIKRPKLVKPLSILIEIGSVLIVIIAVWSLMVLAKSGVALFVYGTCDVSTPSSCSLDASESCTIDTKKLGFFESIGKFKVHEWFGNWFVEFGEAISAIPARVQRWEARDYMPEHAVFYGDFISERPAALDIFDPGCSVCRLSYINQKESGFFDENNVAFLIYPIDDGDGGYNFKNSLLISKYIEAMTLYEVENGNGTKDSWLIINRLFTEYDEREVDYQTAFNSSYDAEKAEKVLLSWLKDFGYLEDEIKTIQQYAHSEEVTEVIKANKEIVNSQIKTKKIPTTIYDGKRHAGLFEVK